MSHHTLELTPSDLIFFRDGRPMEGSATGNGAAWPLPNVLSSAIHHALRRAAHRDVHGHTPKRSGQILAASRERQFGSLQSAGPFPVDEAGRWLFPRPADAQSARSAKTTHRPVAARIAGAVSSLPGDLKPVVAAIPPSKDTPEPWISCEAFEAYLRGSDPEGSGHFLKDERLFGAEHHIGIGIDPFSGTQDGEQFYSAAYLRLRENVRLGLVAACMDKGREGKAADTDLIAATFPNSGRKTSILAGGQQRTCSVTRHTPGRLPLPVAPDIHGTRVRWTLLTPAIFPKIPENREKQVVRHSGGWLPTWIDSGMGIQLKDSEASCRQPGEGREAWRRRVAGLPAIQARLVAAVIPKPIPVTGWALHDTDDSNGRLSAAGGARATHLAVPAGAVYYFECETEAGAKALAAALNWHGTTQGSSIENRRSTLVGEKGFGLGVCSNWSFHNSDIREHLRA